MPSRDSLQRLVRLTRKVREELRGGGMAVTFRYIFRSTAILARVSEILAEQVAREAEEREALLSRVEALERQLRALPGAGATAPAAQHAARARS